MPDFRQTGDKPMRAQDHLGTDVKLETKAVENDLWAQNTLKDIGRYMVNVDKQEDSEYMGSVAVHFYKSKDLQTTNGQYGVALITQNATGDINEYIVMMALSNLVVEMRKAFGKTHKTRDTNDKRGLST